jgi:hypothetical protein
VNSLFWTGTVRAFAGNSDVEGCSAGHHWTRADGEFPSDLAETAKPSDLESEAVRNASRDGGEHSVKIFGVLIAQDEPCGL